MKNAIVVSVLVSALCYTSGALSGPLHLDGSRGRTIVNPVTGITTEHKKGTQVADFVMQGELAAALEEVNTVTNHITEVTEVVEVTEITEVTEVTNVVETTIGVSEEDLAGALRASYRYAEKAADEALSMALAAGGLLQATNEGNMVSVAGSTGGAVAVGISANRGSWTFGMSGVFKGDRKEGVLSAGYEF